ncbi:hypothetical protein MJH12_09185, partial [bacterium]|nr:hypothetical protein [bacterium]
MYTILPNSRKYFDSRSAQKTSHKGVVIFVAVFVIGVVAGIAAIYSYPTRHSKMSSRRMFYGETVFFVAESALDEAFLKLQSEPSLVKSIFDAKGEYIALDFSLDSMSLDSLSESGVSGKDIKVIAKSIVLKSGEIDPSSFMFPEEKLGVIELVVTTKLYGGGFRSGKPTTRQVTGRRNFRYVQLIGPMSHTNYALFIKHKTAPTKSRASSANNLTVYPGSSGRIYLGTDDSKTWQTTKHILRPTYLSSAEQAYLKSEGFEEDGSGAYIAQLDNIDQLIEGTNNRLIDSNVFIDSLMWDPVLERNFIPTGSYSAISTLAKEDYRRD